MADCPTEERLLGFLTGRLEAADAARVLDHLEDCAVCMAVIAHGRSQLPAAAAPTIPVVLQQNAAAPQPALSIVDPGHYQITGEYARGGLGRILEARDHRLDRPVALKELLRGGDDATARFVREALVTARLQHPSIVPIYEAGRWPTGEPFYAMKMVSGRSLKQVIAGAQTLDQRLALVPNVIAVADAIAYAHGQRVIHRDLKPANILVGAFGETIVIDWGLAKDLDTSDENQPLAGAHPIAGHALTVEGAVMGTPEYMPPEQARGESVGEPADVYALGAILYQVLVGEPPYWGRSAAEVLARVVSQEPIAVERRQSGIPHELAAIVRKAMARLPNERYPSAKELAEDLRRFQTGQLVGAHEYSRGHLARRWLGRNRRPVAVAAVLLAALGTTALFSVRRIVQERDRAEDERARAEARSNELILVQARTSLDRDPTATLAWLKTYPKGGAGWAEVRNLADDARSRGVARHVFAEPAPVYPVAFSADGTRFATAASYRLHVWDSASGRLLSDRIEESLVTFLAFSPDGRWLASSAMDGIVQLWEPATGQVRTLRGHEAAVYYVAFAPDGKRLASAAQDKTVRLWDLSSGASKVLSGPRTSVDVVHFAPDGESLAGAGQDGLVWLWPIDGGPPRELRGHTDSVHDLAFLRDGRRLATASQDKTIRLWNLVTREVQVLRGHTDVVDSLAVSPDGHWLASASHDKDVRLWDLARGESRVLAGHANAVTSVAFSPDGRWLASGGLDGVARLWRVATGEVELLRGHGSAVNQVQFSPDGKLLATAGADNTARLWPVPTGDTVTLRGPEDDIYAVAFSPDGHRIAGGGHDKVVHLWDLDTGSHRRLTGHHDSIRGLAFSPDGGQLASAGWDGTARLWDSATGAEDTVLDAEGSPVRCVAFSHDGGELAFAGRDGVIRLWNASSRSIRTLAGHTQEVRVLLYVPNSSRLASASTDGTIRLWDPASGNAEVLRGHDKMVFRLAFSRDGGKAASAGNDQRVLRWDLATGKSALFQSPIDVWDISPSPDGRQVAIVGVDRRVFLWDADTGNLRTMTGHDAWVRSVAFSPDGNWLASTSQDQTVRLWSVSSGAGAIVHRHDGFGFHVWFSPDGRLLASSGFDRTLRIRPIASVPILSSDDRELRTWMEATTSAVIGPENISYSPAVSHARKDPP